MSVVLHQAQEHRGNVWWSEVFTFARLRWGSLGASSLMALALAGCAPAGAPVTQNPAPETASALHGPAYATVASVRPLRDFGMPANDPDAAILPAMGLAGGSTVSRAPPGSASEVVVRTDGGETLSVVQSGAALSPGERVRVLPGNVPRLTPVTPAG